jgi:hemerythrin-like domain-containing protein
MKITPRVMALFIGVCAMATFGPAQTGGGAVSAQPVLDGGKTGSEAPSGEVTPDEDLMREHGVLRRVMLIYDHELNLLKDGEAPHYDVIFESATIVHVFIEGYHEKLEEDYIFPLFEKAGTLTDLTSTLRRQHKAGRAVTESILLLAKEKHSGTPGNPNALAESLTSFLKMYRPHAAREDTVLFPGLKALLSAAEYSRLGDQFEDREHELFGEQGFEGKVNEVAAIEKEIGIYDLGQFTPK